MANQEIKLYQAGTFVAGNRLLDLEERSVQARTERSNTLTSGHRACQGCGEALGARYTLDAAMRATDGKLIATNHRLPRGLLDPLSGVLVAAPWIHSLFGNAPAVASGVAAALRAQGREHVRDRPGRRRRHARHRLRLPLGDVRAQRRRALRLLRQRGLHEHRASSARARPRRPREPRTPSPSAASRERLRQGQERPLIAMAHEIPYVATATVAELRDLEAKVERAMQMRGARYMHVFVPARSAGVGFPRHDPDRPPGQGDRARSRCSRPRTARSPGSPRSAGRCRSRST